MKNTGFINNKIEELVKIGDKESVTKIIREAETCLGSRAFAIEKLGGINSPVAVWGIGSLGKLSVDDALLAINVVQKNIDNNFYDKDFEHAIAGFMSVLANLYPEHSEHVLKMYEGFNENTAAYFILVMVNMNSDCARDAASSLRNMYKGDPNSIVVGAMLQMMKDSASAAVPILSNFLNLRSVFAKSADQEQVDIFDQIISDSIASLVRPHLMSANISEQDMLDLYAEACRAEMVVADLDVSFQLH